MKKLLLITLFLGWAALSFAAKVDTLLIKSPSMNKDVKVVVVTPDVALGKSASLPRSLSATRLRRKCQNMDWNKTGSSTNSG